jgi:hypothetical protein
MNPITNDQGRAVAAWTAHHDAHPEAAIERLRHIQQHGVPEGHEGEWLGANLALTPLEKRCDHSGDKTTCPTCLHEELVTEAEAKRARKAAAREENRRQSELQAKDEVIGNHSAAIDALGRKLKIVERQRDEARRRRWRHAP